jgi:hypothetical protein
MKVMITLKDEYVVMFLPGDIHGIFICSWYDEVINPAIHNEYLARGREYGI